MSIVDLALAWYKARQKYIAAATDNGPEYATYDKAERDLVAKIEALINVRKKGKRQ